MKLSVVVFAIMFLFCGVASAATIDFGWDANTESDLAGYRLYQSTTAGSYVKGEFLAEILAPAVTYTLENVADGTYYYVLTAYDNNGNESDFSNEVTADVDQTAPAAPQGFWSRIRELISRLFGLFRFNVNHS